MDPPESDVLALAAAPQVGHQCKACLEHRENVAGHFGFFFFFFFTPSWFDRKNISCDIKILRTKRMKTIIGT